MLESEWEDPQIALAEGRPRRRLYRITAAGQAALAEATKAAAPAIKPLNRPVMP
jgi:DNA-binding PadR family transcriptional regulator